MHRSPPIPSQTDYEVRFEWGLPGLEALATGCDTVVVVDTLSFSTAVVTALGCGAKLYPYRFSDDSARAVAKKLGASLAVRRRSMSATRPFSLSPESMEKARPGQKIVLPSPNGATLSLRAAEIYEHVLCGCLRNATAVAIEARSLGHTVAVIAAGERWRGSAGEMRVAVEDLLGAGAILSHMHGALSPEAKVAAEAFRAASSDIEKLLLECTSGRQLAESGYAQDVRLAAQVDVSRTVPHLVDGAYVPLAH